MDVKLPNLGEGADSGTVVNLFVKEGDRIEKDQPVLELENEKAVATIPSTAAGVITKVFVKTGDKISVGQRLIAVGESGAAAAPAPAEKKAAEVRKEAPATRAVSAPAAEPMPAAGPEMQEEVEAPVARTNGPVAAGPAIRKLATDLGIDLTRIRGSARGGRIVMSDVRAYVQRLTRLAEKPQAATAVPGAAKPAPERDDFSKWGEVTKKPLSSLRKVISRRMTESWQTIPQVTQFDDADVSGLNELRKKYAPAYEKQGARLTMTPFILKAVAAALKQHRTLNASLDAAAEEIVFKEYYHIGMAVDTEAGLIVPVIRNVDKKSLLELSKDLEELARKARDRKVSTEELKGGTFTISNQGGIGGTHFTPIVNQPEVAILGLGRSVLKPVVRDGKIEARMMLPLGLSYDHRVIDGGSAARFIVDVVKGLETFPESAVKI
jgi:pyruvate dehydrogenase E2 component (dihydrolipoamide acetyltransferase)